MAKFHKMFTCFYAQKLGSIGLADEAEKSKLKFVDTKIDYVIGYRVCYIEIFFIRSF